jgi:long-chain acyl-CoA synthetase
VSSALVRRLNRHADSRPDAVAIHEVDADGSQRLFTWEQLRIASAAARALYPPRDEGVVMICAPNRIEALACMLGGLWSGSRILAVSPDLPTRELSTLAEETGAVRLIADKDTLDAFGEHPMERVALELGAEPGPRATDAAGGASILLKSSGTTGRPRVVRRSMAALDAVGRSCTRALGVREADRLLLTIPLCHSYGIDLGLLTAIYGGCTVELHTRFDRGRVAEALEACGVSLFPAVPWIFDVMARMGGAAPALRCPISAGSPLPERLAERFEKAYGVRIGQIYGATEFGSVTFNDPRDPDYCSSSVGRPLEGVEIRILEAGSRRLDQPLPVGSEGEVAVSSPSLLSEYVGDPKDPVRDGFLLTGDLGRVDPEGRLHLTGRFKLLIDVGGLKVNPVEVEDVLMGHPGVREAVVFAVPYTNTAARIKAIIVPEPSARLDGRDLRRFASERLSRHMIPRIFEVRDEVPRSPSGKILRSVLQAEVD